MKKLWIFLLLSLTTMACFAGASEREKMLLRFILQEDFARDPGLKLIHTNSLETILTHHIKSTNALLRQQAILSLGTTGWGSQLDPEKAKQVLREVLKAETGTGNWVKLDAARVLAWFGDDAGKGVLADAFYARDGFMTQSGIEYRKAVIPLLIIDYDFPQGLPGGTMIWGGLQDYLKDESIRRTTQAQESPSAPAITNGSCRITITNPSSLAHEVSVVTSDGTVIVEGSVPILNKEPPVWKMINFDVSGQNVVVTIDGKKSNVLVATGTVELVVDVGSSSQTVTQHTERIHWR